MASSDSTPCKIHNVPKKKLPEQYYCPKCKNEYQNERHRRERAAAKRMSERLYPKNPETIIFD